MDRAVQHDVQYDGCLFSVDCFARVLILSQPRLCLAWLLISALPAFSFLK